MPITRYFQGPSSRVPGAGWFRKLSSMTLVFVIFYLLLHLIFGVWVKTRASQRVAYLTTEELTVVGQLLDQRPNLTGDTVSDSMKRQDSIIIVNCKRYLFSHYQTLAGDTAFSRMLETTPTVALKLMLPKAPVRQSSFFWLTEDYVYIEIIFWCLFGVLANLLYSTSEYLRKNEFDKLEVFVQKAKLLYSPFCVIVIYICYDQIQTTGTTYVIQYTYYSIAVSFLLGFFSGRMIDLLSRLKDLLIPLSNEPPAPATGATDTSVPDDVIKEAIDKNEEAWIQQFDVLGVGLGKKRVNGLLTNISCLLFTPKEKQDTRPKNTIPATIEFQSANGRTFQIPTDVQETGGDARPSYVQAAAPTVCDGQNPKKLGCSVSRLNGDTTGTIGLKVSKNGKGYLLSCYHVLFSPELANGILEVKPGVQPADSMTIISPSKLDGGSQNDVQGKATEGRLTEFLDCALAELDDELLVSNTLALTGTIIKKVIVLDSDHAAASFGVKLVGRTSGLQKGTLVSPYCSCSVGYKVNGESHPILLRGLISTTRISDDGDSGAPVTDNSGNLIGMLVATTPSFSYIIPADRILSEFNVTLKS